MLTWMANEQEAPRCLAKRKAIKFGSSRRVSSEAEKREEASRPEACVRGKGKTRERERGRRGKGLRAGGHGNWCRTWTTRTRTWTRMWRQIEDQSKHKPGRDVRSCRKQFIDLECRVKQPCQTKEDSGAKDERIIDENFAPCFWRHGPE